MKRTRSVGNRILSFLLCLILVLYSCSLDAFAAEMSAADREIVSAVSTNDIYVVSSGDVTCGDLSGQDATDGDVTAGAVNESISVGDVVSDGNCVSDGDYVTDGDCISGNECVTDGDWVIDDGSASDGDAVSSGDPISVGDVAITEEPIGVEVMADADDAERILASGTYYGMDWVVNAEGKLTIFGEYDISIPGSSWYAYSSHITEAVVTATDVESTREWFANLTNLKRVDLSGFSSGRVQDTSYMFFGCAALTKINFGKFKTYNVTDMSYMFYGCKNLVTLDLSSFNTEKVTNMRYMFGTCTSLKRINAESFDTGNVTDMTGMFYSCSDATAINVSGFETDKVTDMSYMFADCNKVTSLNVSGFHTQKVTNFSSMFENCHKLSRLNVKNFDTENAKYMSAVFSGCSGLSVLDLSSFETGNVTSFSYLFGDCHNLKKLDISGFKTSKATNIDGMFYKCFHLQVLNLEHLNLTKVTSATDMLTGCGSLEQLVVPRYLKVDARLPYEMISAEDGQRYTCIPQSLTGTMTLTPIPYEIHEISDQIYNGGLVKPEIVVSKDDEILTPGVDYTVTYRNNKKVASAEAGEKAPTVIVKGKGRFSGKITRTFHIVAKEITEENVVVENNVSKTNGRIQKLKPSVMVDGIRLSPNRDYLVEYPDKTEGAYQNPGIYDVLIIGKGNYTGQCTASLVILDREQAYAPNLKVSGLTSCSYQKGKPATPKPLVTYKGKTLVCGEDYALRYEDNDRPGKATVIVEGLKNTKGTYVYGTVKKKFNITGIPIRKASAEYEDEFLYTGRALCPAVTLCIDGVVLNEGTDYTVSYKNNVNVGRGQIVLTGCGGYTGVLKKYFTIRPDSGVGDLLDICLADEDGCVDYCTDGAAPKVVVKYQQIVLKEGIDYSVYYQNNTSVGNSDSRKPPTAVIKGIGNYKFTRKIMFSIQAKSLEDEDILIKVEDKARKEADWRSKPVITDQTGATLRLNKDYKIVGYTIGGVAYDKDNIPLNATRGIVTIKGVGGYLGQVSVMYRITDKSIQDISTVVREMEYEGQEVVFDSEAIELGALVINDKTSRIELIYGQDYEIVGYRNNNRCGTARVTIRGLGEYGGTKTIAFKIKRKNLT